MDHSFLEYPVFHRICLYFKNPGTVETLNENKKQDC
jgi:hypothetical protein